MLDRADKFFVQPRQVLAARKVEVFDAINLVVYAKIPLVSARRGWDLIAGFVSLDNTGTPRSVLSKMDVRGLLGKYAQVIGKLTYPVAPLQYEAVLWEIAEAKESMLPYFYHEHHFLVDRKRRAELFLKLHTELRKLVENEKIILQISDSERTNMLAPHAWMTSDTFRGYLRANGVEPWWSEEENIQSHGSLERILLSDGLRYERPGAIGIDYDQLPSYLFAAMLLKRGLNPFKPATQEVWSMPIVPAFPAEQVTNSPPLEVAPRLEQQHHPVQKVQSAIADISAPVNRVESKDLVALLIDEAKRLKTNQARGDQGGVGDQDDQGARRAQEFLVDPAAGRRLADIWLRAQPDFAHEVCSEIPSGSSSGEMPVMAANPLRLAPQRVGPQADDGSKEEASKADTPKADAPKEEAPKEEAPKEKAHKADSPKADARHEEDIVLINKKEVLGLLGLSSPTSISNYENKNGFPKSIEIGPNTKRWDRAEVMAWINARRSK